VFRYRADALTIYHVAVLIAKSEMPLLPIRRQNMRGLYAGLFVKLA
jgi:hypothetical protein